MQLFHRTYFSAEILAGGFIDSVGTYGIGYEVSGVWLSNEPLDINEGADGDVLLALEIPEEVIAEYEWVEEMKPYREFLVPAEIVNQYGPPIVVDEDLD